MSSYMEVQQLALASFWHKELSSPSSSATSTTTSSTLNIGFKRLRSLAPKFEQATGASVSQPKAEASATHFKHVSTSPHHHSAGSTRWNPTPEQTSALEALYRGGLRTPNAHQIEMITAELVQYGRIEGKNVFYWFQNHKARERQKQKRAAVLALADASPDDDPVTSMLISAGAKGRCKRRSRSWESVEVEEKSGDGTLELFPLHPECGRS